MHTLEQYINLCWPHRHSNPSMRHFIKQCVAALRGKGPAGLDIMWVDIARTPTELGPAPYEIKYVVPVRKRDQLLEPEEKNRYHPATAADLRRAERGRHRGRQF